MQARKALACKSKRCTYTHVNFVARPTHTYLRPSIRFKHLVSSCKQKQIICMIMEHVSSTLDCASSLHTDWIKLFHILDYL